MDSGDARSSADPTRQADLADHIAAAWSEALGGIAVSTDDDFFDIGGHSLAIAAVAARVKAATGIVLDFEDFFDHPTARRLATVASTGAATAPAPAADGVVEPAPPDPPTQPAEPAGWSRLASVTQEHRLLFNRRMNDGRTQPVCITYSVSGPLDVARLRRALDGLVRRHDALRTTFPIDADEPVRAAVGDAAGATWQLTERTLHGTDVAEEAQRLLQEFCDAPFDLAAGPLTSALVLHLQPDPSVPSQEHVLALAIEHLVCDGISLTQLISELAESYETGVVPTEPAPSYIAYSEAQRRAFGPQTAVVEHWQREFDTRGMYPPQLRPTPKLACDAYATGVSKRVELAVDPAVLARLAPSAAARRSTVFMMYLTAILRGLRPGVEADAIGAVFMESGRRGGKAEGLVGNLAHEVSVWVDVPEDAESAAVLDRVREEVTATWRNSMPLWWMVRRYHSAPGAVQEFTPDRLDERLTIPWMYFSVLDTEAQPLRLAGAEVRPYPRRTEIPYMRTPLLMATATVSSGEAVLSFDFAEPAYDPDALQAALERAHATLVDLTTD
jgi:Condensation domain/Phosphopantetheine attachment site